MLLFSGRLLWLPVVVLVGRLKAWRSLPTTHEVLSAGQVVAVAHLALMRPAALDFQVSVTQVGTVLPLLRMPQAAAAARVLSALLALALSAVMAVMVT